MRCLVLLFLLLLATSAVAATVHEKSGSIVYVGRDGVPRQLTAGYVDSSPLLSPDGEQVAFVRSRLHTAAAEINPEREIWLTDLSGKAVRRLVATTLNDDPEKNLAGFNSLAFSPDGRQLYFLSTAWVTSDALHVLELQTGRERFITGANSVHVLQRGRYAGHLVVQQHRYFTGRTGGSYDYYWLITPSGKEVRLAGRTDGQAEQFIRRQQSVRSPEK